MKRHGPTEERFGGAALWFCALWLAIVAPASALDPTRAIPQYTHTWYQEQLPQNTVLSIVQRRDGSMWFATFSGLARYSGAEFEVIDKRSAKTLESTAIMSLLEDKAGTLWIGTLNGGLYRLRGNRGVPERVGLPAPINSVFAIAQDSHGGFWFGTNAGVLRMDAAGTRLYGESDGIARVPIRGMTADTKGGVWVAMDGGGVAHFHDGTVELLGVAEGLPDMGAIDVHADRAGTLWVGTQSGLARYRNGRFQHVPAAAALDGKRIFTILGDREGNLWAMVDGAGLCRLNAQGLQCAQNIQSLSHDAVLFMFEDREGNLWIGGTNSGVHRISDAKLATAVGTLDSNSVRAIHEDASGTLWVGTEGAGLAVLRGFTLVPYPHNDRLPSVFVRALHGDADGNLWVGTLEGVSRIAPDHRATHFKTDSGLPGANVYAITADAAGGIWLGTSAGLAHLRDGRITVVDAVGTTDIRALYQDRHGRLWIGQQSGLQCLRGARLDRCGTADGLPTSSVLAFHEAADGTMWVGTSKGILRLRDGKITRYTERDGLHDDVAFTILDDGVGGFWTSSNRGIARLAKSDFPAFDNGAIAALRPRLFGRNDGMLSNQANGASQPSGLRARDGRLWYATPRGLVMVDPARLRHNQLPPLVSVERVVVDAVNQDPDRIRPVSTGGQKLEFHYAAMSFVSPDAVRYRYRLDGFDSEWVDAGTRRVAYYTNLRPGDYAFRVIAANNDGVWNNTGDSVAFSIVPEYYETQWFRTLLGLVAIAALVALYRFRVWRLRANERELMHVVAERTDALRKANAELMRMASLDGLTRIGNRAAFDAALARLWDDHRARGASLAVILCDIDEFKAYNDTYGHQAGDTALIRVAATLQAQARLGTDVAARYGGEEFALLLATLKLPDAIAAATRLLDAVRQLGIPHRASTVAPHVTLSIGVVALIPDGNVSSEQAILAADQALYRAKNEGRDRVVVGAVAAAEAT